ncbi:MAG TPA: UDP-N-acetylmuramate--L-alanine ligase [Bacilli bacterium]|nr:UDP-N-acetylmuramate--L-alanine ligase [Bacilli bacterium]
MDLKKEGNKMRYHFIGIKGSGMAALAMIMHDLGNEVQGSDVDHHLFTEDDLIKKGIKILPFNENNIEKDMIVVIGNTFDESNIEVKKTLELGIKHYKYYELLGELVSNNNSIAIAGCHGKTTTTALIAHVFDDLVGANYLIGDGTGHANNINNYFFFEACEYKRHFLYYYPKYIILTNIELDHVDYYKDLDDIKSAYEEFLRQCDNYIVACGDDVNIRSLNTNKEIIYYGFNDNNDYIAKNVELTSLGSSFDVYNKDKLIGHFDLPLYGKHMILNALSVIVFSYLNNLNMEEVHDSIKTFRGAKRRFSEKVIGDIITIDDYAHHPTEVKVTLEAIKQKYPDKELVVVFLENTFSRTQKLYKDFANALNVADKAYVTDIFSDREKQEDFKDVSPMLIVNELRNGEYLKIGSVDKLIDINDIECIEPLLKHKDAVIVFMGCKEVYDLKEKLEKRLLEK